uniref:dynamin GTPase n=1 Tax=Macrostomum lignano TaxID=282301 RepID=A0A1I8F657_9PLAT
MLPLEGLRVRDGENRLFSKRSVIVLFNADGRLQESGACGRVSDDDVDTWKAALLRAGVYPEGDEEEKGEEETLDRRWSVQVETIRSLAKSYMRIVDKAQRDFVPKTIIHISFLKTSLPVQLYSCSDQTSLMEESEAEATRRVETARAYKATVEALRVLSEVAIGGYGASSGVGFSSGAFNISDNVDSVIRWRAAETAAGAAIDAQIVAGAAGAATSAAIAAATERHRGCPGLRGRRHRHFRQLVGGSVTILRWSEKRAEPQYPCKMRALGNW